MTYGEIITARTVAAIIIGAAILAVSLSAVMDAYSVRNAKQAEVDGRRIAEIVELADHKRGATYHIEFSQEYEAVELTDEAVAMTMDGETQHHHIFISSPVSGGQLTGVTAVCIQAPMDGSLVLSETCDITEVVQ